MAKMRSKVNLAFFFFSPTPILALVVCFLLKMKNFSKTSLKFVFLLTLQK